MGTTIDQYEVELHYNNTKRKVSQWLLAYTNSLKRLNADQREQLTEYATDIDFKTAQRLTAYAQTLSTISKRDKRRLTEYMDQIEWLPQDVSAGILDGQLVAKMLPSTQAEKMIRAAFSDENEEDDDVRDRYRKDAET